MRKGNTTERKGKRKVASKKATRSEGGLTQREQEELVLEFRVKARKALKQI